MTETRLKDIHDFIKASRQKRSLAELRPKESSKVTKGLVSLADKIIRAFIEVSGSRILDRDDKEMLKSMIVFYTDAYIKGEEKN